MATSSKKKKVQDILLYIEGQDTSVPAGQRQMRILYKNKKSYGTSGLVYRQFKIQFAECGGWEAITEKLASRDCLSVTGFKDTVKFPVIHSITVERVMNMSAHFDAGPNGIQTPKWQSSLLNGQHWNTNATRWALPTLRCKQNFTEEDRETLSGQQVTSLVRETS